MKAAFHEGDQKIFDCLIMVFRRIPNRMNIGLTKLPPTRLSVHSFA